MNFGDRISIVPPRPPEKGSFPLDHLGECKVLVDRVLACMRKHEQQSRFCRLEFRDYLQCRMDKGLMQKEDFSKLDLDDPNKYKNVELGDKEKKEEDGFVAGVSRRNRKLVPETDSS
ncbi:mitochondrial CIV assembly protein Cox19 [Andalucia godoyi]|uniref:Mitochondrial CIV assembly protein Cox19 n=1 Tax=Andalucia godoyi TaxID=505711 RepID=A0A8K0AIW3_ANDGO|nr:mitochondrial CIV assembly protein Cox19 [Andalucia godoyi]|eukprot:ANDGO_08607.mRNA.1 mitochondrial CIV assembly protein Cox19